MVFIFLASDLQQPGSEEQFCAYRRHLCIRQTTYFVEINFLGDLSLW